MIDIHLIEQVAVAASAVNCSIGDDACWRGARGEPEGPMRGRTGG
ncbi:MAG TPA: hypothetical protein VEX86_05860 [Longimicrobium sp.]|nr:hypothetical protein [Longimicrobium sp.]